MEIADKDQQPYLTEVKKILIAIDKSGYKNKIVAYAITLAKALDAGIYAIHVIDESSFGVVGDMMSYYRGGKIDEYRKILAKQAEQLLDDVSSEIRRVNKNIKVATNVIIDSSVPNAIIGYAKKMEIDLVIVGSQGMTGLEKFLMGSVANKVIIHAHCPVLAIR
ncbi:MAG TPA: universal stress protein [Nitrososphaeraceae archaeon]|jgi:nucleotide-binding universal stress UspA family protein